MLAIVDLAKTKGYELAATTLVNAFFVQRDDFPKLNIVDNSIDAIDEPYMDTQICQAFDGTIFAAGHMQLTWHELPLSQEDSRFFPRRCVNIPNPGKRAQAPRANPATTVIARRRDSTSAGGKQASEEFAWSRDYG